MTNMYTIGFLLRRELPINEDLAHRDTTLKNGNAEIFYKEIVLSNCFNMKTCHFIILNYNYSI